MSMSEFTQGEWKLNTDTVRVSCAVACAVQVKDDLTDTIAIIPKRAGKTQSEKMANGRLIEAAPEMFSLLEDYLNPKLHARSKDYHDLLERTVALLNRVIGKENDK